MKVQIVPVYFEPGRDDGFDRQLGALRTLLEETVEFLPPVALGTVLPPADAVIFPQLLGEGYRRLDEFKAIDRPILIVTSEFGTLSMWDWELVSYLRTEGVPTIAPYTLQQTKNVIAALRVRRELRETKFLVYQDNPGEGQQAPIFKRFYWWESECTERMTKKFGLRIEKRSFKELGARAKAIPDAEAEAARRDWNVPADGLGARPLNSAAKLYLAIRRDLAADRNIRGVGMNCLNESHFSDTTPCLAWNRFYMEDAMIWGCEGDTVSMLTKYILHRSLGAPILMTNLYPFALGDAALKHERIEHFPAVKHDPRNYVLVAHCGFMGVIPQSFTSQWTLRRKVLGIVDENATAIDARLPEGPVTLAKLHPDFNGLTVSEGDLEGYAQYPGSDCHNGGIIRVNDGHRLMTRLTSHHALLMTSNQAADIETIAPIFGLELETI
ncbi:conserved hypothetical protein [uncultured Defluviicoccus sp.]|uniref:L-fucose isomerase n=1 Tax=metagenome TaxID=256318 RepID=A0A380TEI9_9ZZZZ|nr:conserved hypothetical protein [uncultured Defluviicoccus sp.]